MKNQNNSMKSSAAALAFFMSAAAWVVSAADLEVLVPEQSELRAG